MARPKGSRNKTKQVEPVVQQEIQPAVTTKDIIYVLASDLMMPTKYTKYLCRENNRWIVHNAYHSEFLQLFPTARIQEY